jgi:hypothetical protein
MRKKISTTIYVTPEQADRLKLLHERTKVPVAVYIREGIDLVLRHYAHMLPGQLALVPEALDTDVNSPRPPDVQTSFENSFEGARGRTALSSEPPPPSVAASGKK